MILVPDRGLANAIRVILATGVKDFAKDTSLLIALALPQVANYEWIY